MLLEMHSHTAEFSSCSRVAAVDLVRRACTLGLQGIVLTDHHHWWPPEEIRRLRRQAALPDHFLLLSGQEVTTFDVGDVLVYGAAATIRKGTPLAVIRERFPAAAIVWAHPYRDERLPTEEQLRHPHLDAVEIFNSNQTHLENSRGLRDWHRYRFTAIGGTDTHAESYTGTYPTLFDHPLATAAELAAELRRGRCRPWFEEVPHSGSNIRLTELTLGLPKGEREKIIVKEFAGEKWGSAERAFAIVGDLHRQGFPTALFRLPRPLARAPRDRTLVEEGIRGATLYDEILRTDAAGAAQSIELTAGWLARLHGMRLNITPAAEFFPREEALLAEFLAPFRATGHRLTRRAGEVLDHIRQAERLLYGENPEILVQGHGDFNPKNVLVGRHPDGDPFVAAIDFDYSGSMPPALDVGTMLAQLRFQFFRQPAVTPYRLEQQFLTAYRRATGNNAPRSVEIDLFRARANLSIAYYLVRIGLGGGEELWRVLVEADRSMAKVAMQGY